MWLIPFLYYIYLLYISVIANKFEPISFDPQSLKPESSLAIFDNDSTTCTSFRETAGSSALKFTQFRIKFPTDVDSNFSVQISGHSLGCDNGLYLSPLSATQAEQWLGQWNICKFLRKTEDSYLETCYYNCSFRGCLEVLQLIYMPNTPDEYSWELCHISIVHRTPGVCSCQATGGQSVILPGDSSHTDIFCGETSEESGWIVLMRRVSDDVDFNKEWNEYKYGFGDIFGNFWGGNEMMHKITTDGNRYLLRVELMTEDGKFLFAEYNNFWVDSENNNYRLHVTEYLSRSTAEDALRQHNLMEFSTPLKDNDLNDGYNCSASHEAGWWYTDCKFALLTAKFGPYNTISKYKGITWFPDCDGSHFATYARMMIKPT